MNNLNWLGVLICLIVGCASGSGLVGSVGRSPVNQRIENGTVSFTITTKEKDSTDFTIEYEYYTIIDSVYKDSVNTIIQQFFFSYEDHQNGRKVDTLTPGFFMESLEKLAAEYYDYIEEDEYATLWSFDERIDIDDSHPSFVEISYGGWSYMGGAHGNGFENTLILDKQHGEDLELEDFVSNIEELTRIGKVFFREQNLYKGQEEMTLEQVGYEFGEDGFYLNDNFNFSGGSINFHYNSYEIGPYALPPSDVSIPLDKIRHLLTREI